MICPICNQGELKEQISLKNILFLRKKEVTTFCPLCGFRKVNEFKLTQDDFEREKESIESERNIERIKAENTIRKEVDKKEDINSDREFRHKIEKIKNKWQH